MSQTPPPTGEDPTPAEGPGADQPGGPTVPSAPAATAGTATSEEAGTGAPAATAAPASQAAAPPAVAPPAGLLDSAVGVVTSPTSTLRSLAAHPRLGWAFVVVVVLSALSTIAEGPGAPEIPGAPAAGDGAAASLYVARIVGGALLATGLLAGGAALLHGLARLLGGVGDFRGTLTVIAFATVPNALAVPVQLLPALPIPQVLAGTLAGLISVALLVWVVTLLVQGMRLTHGITVGRAIAVVALPVAILVGVVLLLVVLAGAALVAALA